MISGVNHGGNTLAGPTGASNEGGAWSPMMRNDSRLPGAKGNTKLRQLPVSPNNAALSIERCAADSHGCPHHTVQLRIVCTFKRIRLDKSIDVMYEINILSQLHINKSHTNTHCTRVLITPTHTHSHTLSLSHALTHKLSE